MMTVVALAADPLTRAELGRFLDGLDLLVAAELAPDDLEGFLTEQDEPDAYIWEADEDDVLPALSAPLLALVARSEDARHALRGGATGVLERGTDGERLLTALGALQGGLAVLEPALLPFSEPDPDTGFDTGLDTDLEPLTPRERDVLNLLAEGLPNKAIAKRLGVSEHTVKFHLNAVLGKLGARSRTEAVTKAVRAGLLTL